MKHKLRMLYDRLLVKMVASNEKTSGGLFIPDIARDATQWRAAEVISVGTGHLLKDGILAKLQCKVGDCIWFFRQVGHGKQVAVEVDGEEYLIIPEECVMCIVPPEMLRATVDTRPSIIIPSDLGNAVIGGSS